MAVAGVRLLDGGSWALQALVLLLCLRPVSATKYVVHYMPWFLGEDSGHWCNADWGNSFYDSVFGKYDVRDLFTVRRQLLLMKAAGIDGLWFDFQKESWVPRIRAISEEALNIGLNFAIMADNYMDENVTNSLQEALADFMAMPNYYWVDGRPLLPIFEAPSRWQSRDTILPNWHVNGSRPFVVGTYHWHQRESVPLPDGYDSLFFWISTDLIWAARYHQSTRFSLKVGSVYRGWREAYKTWHHAPPYLGFLNSTLQIIQDNQPDFAQIVTWNDYTEGTMLEPSFIRGEGGCLDPNETYWVTMNATCNKQRRTLDPCLPGLWAPCSGSGEELCSNVQDCTKPYAAVEGQGVAGCPSEIPGGGPLSAYHDLAMIANAILGTPISEAIATFRSVVEVERPTTTTSTSTGTSTTRTTTTGTTTTGTTTTGTTTTDGSFKSFEPEADGADSACRGSSATDSSEAYYTLTFGVETLIECQALCLQEVMCTGVEFNGQQGRCEVWTEPIGVKVARSGFACLLRQDHLAEASEATTTSTRTSTTTVTRTTTTSPTTTATATATTAPTTATTRTTTTTLTTTATFISATLVSDATPDGSATSTITPTTRTSTGSSLGPTTTRSTTASTTTTSTATLSGTATPTTTTLTTTMTLTSTTAPTTATTRTRAATPATTTPTPATTATLAPAMSTSEATPGTSTMTTTTRTSTGSSLGPTIRSTTALARQPTTTVAEATLTLSPSDGLSTTLADRMAKQGFQPSRARDDLASTGGQATTSTPWASATSAAPTASEDDPIQVVASAWRRKPLGVAITLLILFPSATIPLTSGLQ